MSSQEVRVCGLGWVLPVGVGSGLEILKRVEELRGAPIVDSGLDDFSARPYLQSVKGYLDPAGAYCLSACSLALGTEGRETLEARGEMTGVSTITQYGAPQSGYRFYEQFLQKGARYASPLMFPHGYSNTAGNLGAIEFGFGGPHMVLYGTADVTEALDFAATRLADGTATDMLVACYEAVSPAVVPDATEVLNGAVALWLSSRPDTDTLMSLPLRHGADLPRDWQARGSVQNMLLLLTCSSAVR